MAIVLKTGKTFNPDLSKSIGFDMTGKNYYGVIDKIEYNKKEKTVNFLVEIYGSKEVRSQALEAESKAQPCHRTPVFIKNEDFDEKIGTNGVTVESLYLVLHSMPEFADWKKHL